jgi:hypothetical protein
MKFSIRDILWLTAVVALAICWYRASTQASRREAEWKQQEKALDTEREALVSERKNLQKHINRQDSVIGKLLTNPRSIGPIPTDVPGLNSL